MPRRAKRGFEFLTRQQIAQALKVPRRTVDHWIATGQLTPIRMSMGLGRGGQRVFYSAAELRRLQLATKARARRRNPPNR